YMEDTIQSKSGIYSLGVQRILRLCFMETLPEEHCTRHAITLHAFQPTWKTRSGTGESINTEIYAVGSPALQIPNQVLWTKKNVVPIQEVSDDKWRLALIAQSRAPTTTIPWESTLIVSNAGPTHMESYPPTPENIDYLTILTVEPVSGAIAIKSPSLLRIVHFE
ncbi:hypothetical protein EW145_g6645, partial [Phellinidium pouzarii]